MACHEDAEEWERELLSFPLIFVSTTTRVLRIILVFALIPLYRR